MASAADDVDGTDDADVSEVERSSASDVTLTLGGGNGGGRFVATFGGSTVNGLYKPAPKNHDEKRKTLITNTKRHFVAHIHQQQ